MAQLVCMGAQLQCSFGAAPSSLVVTRPGKVKANFMAVANINDSKPMANVPPFGTCTAPSNPAVAAAMGAPQPCTPNLAGPWAPPAMHVIVEGQPAVLKTATLACAFGGVITVTNPGQTKANGT